MKLARSTTFKPEKMFSSAITAPSRDIESVRDNPLGFVLALFRPLR